MAALRLRGGLVGNGCAALRSTSAVLSPAAREPAGRSDAAPCASVSAFLPTLLPARLIGRESDGFVDSLALGNVGCVFGVVTALCDGFRVESLPEAMLVDTGCFVVEC